MPIVNQIREESRLSILPPGPTFQIVSLDCGHTDRRLVESRTGLTVPRVAIGDAIACEDCIYGEPTEFNWDSEGYEDEDALLRKAALDHRGRP